ncbi:hypothetical protein WOLCODRAFT_140196 [Wolfiporia cocos MD-104 SS10]|uniref:Uncharacterized protein n=1 Tax=Wolfiporia cocos (strain MD-104) TaxID=742152 RepID=A0A2H3JEE0_WOLCO|nr:hypothetical protein WOLCODRAFT_140196 [Wolfiporia cocos MD-104 SS10]
MDAGPYKCLRCRDLDCAPGPSWLPSATSTPFGTSAWRFGRCTRLGQLARRSRAHGDHPDEHECTSATVLAHLCFCGVRRVAVSCHRTEEAVRACLRVRARHRTRTGSGDTSREGRPCVLWSATYVVWCSSLLKRAAHVHAAGSDR